MFSVKTTPLDKTGLLNNLLADYISQKDELGAFYTNFPDKEGFRRSIEQNNFAIDRDKLASILSLQAGEVENTSLPTRQNISLIRENNTFTVTTGHQLCLFTGPSYFIYKIFSAINLAEELNRLFPSYKFIPVYWAATEDHDFEEVNHFNTFNKRITWESKQQGAVGDFKTAEMSSLLEMVKEIFGTSTNGLHLAELFRKSYLEHSTLSAATRYLVNGLFGKYGLVTVDGDHAALKELFIPAFKKDIFENSAFTNVSETIEALKSAGYASQVNPRPINCFFIEPGTRARIEKENNVYTVIGTGKSFSKDQLLALIENEPGKISPNVVLRPLYQQTILPNIAYVGGPGELAYWLEYKKMFDEFKVQFPVLVPRSFVTIIDKSVKVKMDKLAFSVEDIFKDEQELIRVFQVRSNNLFELDNEKAAIEKLYSSISEKIAAIDKTLTGNVSAEQQRVLNGLDTITGKANRALKQKSETELNHVRSIKEKLFPGKIPQERHENFSSFYIKWGEEFFESLKQNLKPLDLVHVSLVEE